MSIRLTVKEIRLYLSAESDEPIITRPGKLLVEGGIDDIKKEILLVKDFLSLHLGEYDHEACLISLEKDGVVYEFGVRGSDQLCISEENWKRLIQALA